MDSETTSKTQNQLALVSFGSNLGDQSEIWQLTLSQFHHSAQFELVKASSLLVTRPIGGPKGQSDFLNAALVLKTNCSAEQIVRELLQIEKNFGRLRLERWGSRTVDLDLLLLGDTVCQADHCQVPHPRMTFRKFMMIPAVEVASDWIHPLCQKSLGELLSQMDHPSKMVSCFLDSNLHGLEFKNRNQKRQESCLDVIRDLTLKNGLRFRVCSREEFEKQNLSNCNLTNCNLTLFFGPNWKDRFSRYRSDQGDLIPTGPYLWIQTDDEQETANEFSAALDAMKSL